MIFHGEGGRGVKIPLKKVTSLADPAEVTDLLIN